MHPIERIRFAVLMIAVALGGVAGCSAPKAFSLNNAWPWGDDEPKPELPNRVAGMWTDTVLHKAGEKPQRGFGGRLMFYGKEADKPVMVDGELVVYAFDETGREPTDNKPTRRYVFPADQVSVHQSEGPVGPSYSFWLPWDDAGGPQTEVSLICRFQPKGGAVVVSEQTKHMLPGTLRPASAVASYTTPKLPEGVPSRPALPQLSSQLKNAPASNGAQQANYEVAASSVPNALVSSGTMDATPIRHMTTTSIALPRDFQIPQGVAALPMNTNTSNVRQILPPGQPMTTNISVPPPAPGQNALEPPPTNRLATNYQPHARPALPTAYNPMIASASNGQSISQPLQVPPLNTIVPPTVTPQPVLQPAQQIQPTAPQLMQVPANGTATVTYR
ncbi:MAG: hypothetical protein WD468_07500 [Pirellulales bacterium]